MKKAIYILTAAAIILTALSAGISAYGAEAASAEDNYTVWIPAAESYVYLECPEKIAAGSGKTAIYDSALKQIIVVSETGQTVLKDVPETKQMALYDNLLYVLTYEMEIYLYNLDNGAGTVVNTPDTFSDEELETPMNVYVSGDSLYVYGGYRSVLKLNAATFTVEERFKVRKPMEARDIVVIGGTVYYISWDNYVMRFTGDGSAETVPGFEKISPDSAALQSDSLIFAYDGMLHVYNGGTVYSADGKEYSLSAVQSDSLTEIAADGKYLYVLDGLNCVKALSIQAGKIEYVSEFGSSGKVTGRFTLPEDAAVSPDGILAIADNGNNRVQLFDTKDDNKHVVSFNVTTKSLSWSGDRLYMLADGKVYETGENGTVRSVTVGDRFDEIAVIDNLVYLTDGNTVYTLAGAFGNNKDLSEYLTADNPVISVKSSAGGKTVYIMTQSGITGYVNAIATDARIAFGDGMSPVDFEVDRNGNVYLLYGTADSIRLRVYGRNYKSYSVLSDTELTCGDKPLVECSALTASAEGEVYVLSRARHFLAKINDGILEFVTEPTGMPAPEINVRSSSEIDFAEITNAVLYKYCDNYEQIDAVTDAEQVIIFKSATSANDAFYYIKRGDGTYWFADITNLRLLPDEKPPFENIKMLHSTGGDVYFYPDNSQQAVKAHLDNTVPMKILGSASNYSTKGGIYWYEVEYESDGLVQTGFVMRTRVLEYVVDIKVEEEIFAKIKNKLANPVSFYALADDKSEILASLADGTRVQLLEELNPDNPFTLVRYDGQTGYVLTQYLTSADGLTEGQIIGIIIAALTLAITCVFILLSRRGKRGRTANG